jgi:hypothetical protein
MPRNIDHSLGTQVTHTAAPEVAARDGPNEAFLPACAPWAEASYYFVHPVGYGAESVVIEGRHFAGIDAAIRKHAVPAFPDRCRTYHEI